ncbi:MULTISPECIES: tRNA pseudouridine(54/55) synthase Pus10 [Fervidicoccus]|uniref:tRNA pseudouridine(55) synthase n=1 Tax=Fervidicoccus fontis (strain DSM 19380 / JCM 18336 / VKM B-2539 / Kam940) TaxID=1163730 RepID=I0A295_FERFK|nr:tRNA pseudouridine(54/55) synthase Pus10 [Fervidicoccus fontis]AFH43102.1 putative pseudouridine synthase PsuX [Fervidicoccus fontis Kam940]
MENEVLSKAISIMEKYPLCDSCLGRMFSSFLKGFTNEERGKAIKIAIAMELIKKLKSGEEEAGKKLEAISQSLGPEFDKTLEEVNIKRRTGECYLCGGKLKKWVSLYKEAVPILKKKSVESFVVGITGSKEIETKEDELLREFSIDTAESIKSELRREVGKLITSSTGIDAGFTDPGAVIYIDLKSENLRVKVMPLFIKGRYIKAGRNISQVEWFDDDKKQQLSVKGMLSVLSEFYGGEVLLHASGREDVDVRMLGWGRPMVVEIKDPRTRRVPLSYISWLVNKNPYGIFILEEKGKRKDVREIKELDSKKRKIYRIVVAGDVPLNEKDADTIVRELKGKVIEQRTPTRVLVRRKDVARRKKVYDISLHAFSGVLIGLIETDGGLYIKELISGDNGRTKPNFSEILGKSVQCIELDVVKVVW